MIYILSGMVLLGWGIWCLIAAVLGRKVQVQIFYNDEFLPKKILGEYYDVCMNVIYGIICVSFGLFFVFG